MANPRVQPFLMFEGVAEEAMNFYVSLFADGQILEVLRYGSGEAGAEGSVKTAKFSLAGQTVMCIDSPVKHAFTFTASFSFFVDCESEEEINRLYSLLGEAGMVFMPIGNHGFSQCFAWVADRFGVSWQLNFA